MNQVSQNWGSHNAAESLLELNPTTSWSDPKESVWPGSATSDLQSGQPLDSAGSGSTPAEMIAVNPKEVSPMDVDDIQRGSNLSTNLSTNTAINVESTVTTTQLDTNESVNIINSYTT